MFKKFLIKILIKLLERKEETYRDINDELIESFLRNIHQDPGFHEYFRKRELELLKSIRANLDSKESLILLGQNYELLVLALRAKKAHEKKEKERKKKG